MARRPLIGIIANPHKINDRYPTHMVGEMNSIAVSEVAGGMPVLVPADPRFVTVAELIDRFDGFILPGGRPNVHPSEYGEAETPAHGAFDRARDSITLPLVRACVERGQPFFGICRGFQEVAVAMGSTLHPEIRELPGRMNHRMPPDAELEEQFALRHEVHFTPGGVFARLMGTETVKTNTLHGQGICQAAPRVVIEGRADDRTPEAILVKDAPGFTLAVQWHPEFNAVRDPVSRRLFSAFGEAATAWANGRKVIAA